MFANNYAIMSTTTATAPDPVPVTADVNLNSINRDVTACLRKLEAVRAELLRTTDTLQTTNDTNELSRYSLELASHRRWISSARRLGQRCIELDCRLWLEPLSHQARRKYHVLAQKGRWTCCRCYELETLLDEALDQLGQALSRGITPNTPILVSSDV